MLTFIRPTTPGPDSRATRPHLQHIVDLVFIRSGIALDKATKSGCKPALITRLRQALTSCIVFVCHSVGGDIENNVVAEAKASSPMTRTDLSLN